MLVDLLLPCSQKEDKVVYCPGFFDLYRILFAAELSDCAGLYVYLLCGTYNYVIF